MGMYGEKESKGWKDRGGIFFFFFFFFFVTGAGGMFGSGSLGRNSTYIYIR